MILFLLRTAELPRQEGFCWFADTGRRAPGQAEEATSRLSIVRMAAYDDGGCVQSEGRAQGGKRRGLRQPLVGVEHEAGAPHLVDHTPAWLVVVLGAEGGAGATLLAKAARRAAATPSTARSARARGSGSRRRVPSQVSHQSRVRTQQSVRWRIRRPNRTPNCSAEVAVRQIDDWSRRTRCRGRCPLLLFQTEKGRSVQTCRWSRRRTSNLGARTTSISCVSAGWPNATTAAIPLPR